MAGVIVERAAKSFDQVQALDRVSLEVQDGEFLTVLGPSGSGKSTLLRLIAGLEAPDAGRIIIGGKVVCDNWEVWVPPQQRDIGMVFQNYALWPHMTASENVAFPLEMVGLRSPEIASRVREIIALVELAGLEGKQPGQMSGGEQQRVALARALVGRPSILLMDECLSNLDARLREKMAGELRRIQEAVGITTIYVTHDQHEALALSDRIAVLHQGVLQQVGRPGELYRRPRNPLVATTLGPINLLSLAEVHQLGLAVHLPGQFEDSAILGIRPEDILVVPDRSGSGFRPSTEHSNVSAEDSSRIRGRVTKATFMGNAHHYWIEVGPCTLHARIPLDGGSSGRAIPTLSPGDQAWVAIDPPAWIVWGVEAYGE